MRYKTIKDFIKNRPTEFFQSRNQWFKTSTIDAYLIAGFTFTNRGLVSSIKVSNISVTHEKDLGKGHFKALIVEIEEDARNEGYQAVTFENTAHHLAEKLMQHGYVLSKDPDKFDSFGFQLAKYFDK